jgi:hypothetical protein
MQRSVHRKSQKGRKSSAKESKQHKADQSNFDPKKGGLQSNGIELGRVTLTIILSRMFPGRSDVGIGIDDVDMEIAACGKGKGQEI